MLRSEMNACNEWVGAALYLLNSLMPALGQERCQRAQGHAGGRVGGGGGGVYLSCVETIICCCETHRVVSCWYSDIHSYISA